VESDSSKYAAVHSVCIGPLSYCSILLRADMSLVLFVAHAHVTHVGRTFLPTLYRRLRHGAAAVP
jgi:hypothetical protein